MTTSTSAETEEERVAWVQRERELAHIGQINAEIRERLGQLA